MIKFIQNYFLKHYVKKHKPLKEKCIIPLEQAKNLGIVCQIDSEESYKEIYGIFSKLQSPKRNLWLIGYVDEKMVPFYCLQQLSADYFCKKNLNWFGKPNIVQIDDFINKEFDMIIDFSNNNTPPIQYILKMSKTKLLIGANPHSSDLYDIYIQKDPDLQDFDNFKLLKTIHHYLHQFTGECIK